MNKPKPRAVLYARVSTYMQERDGVSLDQQLDLARRFCELRGFELLDTYVDTMTGTSDARPGLVKLEQDLRERAYDHVLVYKVDRLSRDAAHYHRLLQDFERYGVGLGSLTQDIDATTSMGRLILRILIALAEHESEQTGDRVRDSIRYRAQQGRIIMGHHSALGYRYVKAFTDAAGVRQQGRYEVDEDEAATVRFLFEAYLDKRTVTDAFAAARAAGLTGRHGTPLKRSWVRGILANPIYKGELAGCRTRTIKSGGKKTAVKLKPDAWIRLEGRVPPIIDADTWQAAQDLLALNSTVPAATLAARGKFAWSGLMKCACCSHALGRHSTTSGRTRDRTIGRYICAYKHQAGPEACVTPGAVSEAFLDLFVAPAIFKAVQKAISKERASRKPATPKQKKAADVAGELAKLEKRRRKVRDMYELTDMPDEEYHEKMAELNRRIADLQAQQAEGPPAVAALPTFPKDLADVWDRLAAQPAERNRLLGTLIDHVAVTGKEKVRVVFRPYDHPGWPTSTQLAIVNLSSREGRLARGLEPNWSPWKHRKNAGG